MTDILYKGRWYRQAEDTKEDAEQTSGDPCGAADSGSLFVQATEAILSEANIQGTPLQLCQEADGADVRVSVGEAWSGIEAVLTFDFDRNQKLQELILSMCQYNFVAHPGRFGGGKTIKLLTGALEALQQAEFYPQQPQEDVDSKKKFEYIEFLRHYIGELLQGAVDLPYQNRKEFADAIMKLAKQNKYPPDRASVLSEGALRLDDDEWKRHIIPLVKSQGRQQATTQEMLNQAVGELIPSAEKYTGNVHVLAYLDDGSILAGIDVPKPADSFTFVFDSKPGQTKLTLKEAGLGLCKATFSAGADAAKTQQLITAMISLAVLAGRTAQPELSEAPDLVAKEWDKDTLSDAIARGLVIWYGANDYVRMTWQGKSINCWSKDDWDKYEVDAPDSTLKLHVQKAAKNKREFFQVDKEGSLDRLDYRGRVIQKNIGRVDPTGQVCPVR